MTRTQISPILKGRGYGCGNGSHKHANEGHMCWGVRNAFTAVCLTYENEKLWQCSGTQGVIRVELLYWITR